MKFLKLALISAVGVGVGLISQVSASAKTTYQYDYKPYQGGSVPYFTKASKVSKGGVIWNVKHTKKIGDLKDQPYSRWSVEKVYSKRINGKVVSYYYQVVKQNGNGKSKALIWSGYLNKAIAKFPKQFKTDGEYLKYIKTADSQRLTRAILKLFPNTQVSLNLSSMTSNGYIGKTPGFTQVINLSKLVNHTSDRFISSSLWETSGQPVASRVASFDKELTEAGYSHTVREKMTAGKLGIFVADDVQSGFDSKPGLPAKGDSNGNLTVYTIVYGIPTK